MKKILYKKTSYLYGEHEFFLYEPLELDIIQEEYNKQGEAVKIIYRSAGATCSYPIRPDFYTIVEQFMPDSQNMLISGYKGVYVPCIENCSNYYEKTLHLRCRVLPEKQMAYTRLQCECCGKTSLIALNSWAIATGSELNNRECDDHKY